MYEEFLDCGIIFWCEWILQFWNLIFSRFRFYEIPFERKEAPTKKRQDQKSLILFPFFWIGKKMMFNDHLFFFKNEESFRLLKNSKFLLWKRENVGKASSSLFEKNPTNHSCWNMKFSKKQKTFSNHWKKRKQNSTLEIFSANEFMDRFPSFLLWTVFWREVWFS